MLESPADDAPPLVAAPRHLRRRAFHQEIPDMLLVPGAHPFVWTPAASGNAKRQAETATVRRTAYQRKRLAVLIAVIVVSLTIPALLLALILAG